MQTVWVCEYSLKQDCFHVEVLSRICKINKRAIIEKKNSGYVPIGYFETPEQAHQCAREFKKEYLMPMIQDCGGEWECMNCINRQVSDYMSHRDICKFKESGYTCKEIL